MAITNPIPTTMTVAEFHALPDHPRQRDTEHHAKKANKKHLRKMFPTQSVVVVVSYKAVWYKTDGHTRDLLWHSNRLEAPESLLVLRYRCDSRREFNQLYLAHNNKDAAEKPRDLAYGRLRELGLSGITSTLATQASTVASTLLRLQAGTGSLPDGMHLKAMEPWMAQYRHFNQCAANGTRRKLHSGLTVAEFITHRKYGAAISDDFWDRLHARAGNLIEGEADAVQSLQKVYDDRKRRGTSQKGAKGSDNTDIMVGLALRYFKAFRADKWYRSPSSVLSNNKAAYIFVQKSFGIIKLPKFAAGRRVGRPADAVKNARTLPDLPWNDDDDYDI